MTDKQYIKAKAESLSQNGNRKLLRDMVNKFGLKVDTKHEANQLKVLKQYAKDGNEKAIAKLEHLSRLLDK